MSIQRDHLDYKSSADTGQDNEEAIAPIDNGEGANETVLNRSPENLRGRTEATRDQFEDLLYYRDVQQLAIKQTLGETIDWHGTVGDGGDGKFVLHIEFQSS